MSETNDAMLLPVARGGITIRPGTLDDVAFMDALQKTTTKQVGWMPRKQFEGKVAAGHVLIAEATGKDEVRRMKDERRVGNDDGPSAFHPSSFTLHPSAPLGYLIGNDQYFKRDDVGIIYQINVIPEMRRSLVAASLLKAQFERSAYGCRLYCCWCAQDIEANRFWEAMGFVPLAFRTGSRSKGTKGTARTHIFWQKRIRSGDEGDVTRGGTAWWFPSQTSGGAIREDRLVLPIPPGTRWSDVKPVVLPGESVATGDPRLANEGGEIIASESTSKPSRSKRAKSVVVAPAVVQKRSIALSGGMRFAAPTPVVAMVEVAAPEKRPREPRKKTKNDPHLVAAARELRDRWLEQVNAAPPALATAKYDVTRSIDARPRPTLVEPAPLKQLAA